MDILVLQQILNHMPPAISLEEFSVVILQGTCMYLMLRVQFSALSR